MPIFFSQLNKTDIRVANFIRNFRKNELEALYVNSYKQIFGVTPSLITGYARRVTYSDTVGTKSENNNFMIEALLGDPSFQEKSVGNTKSRVSTKAQLEKVSAITSLAADIDNLTHLATHVPAIKKLFNF